MKLTIVFVLLTPPVSPLVLYCLSRDLFLLSPLCPFSLQPQVYRTIIDDVIASVTPDFDEYGLDEEVLQILQAVRLANGICLLHELG